MNDKIGKELEDANGEILRLRAELDHTKWARTENAKKTLELEEKIAVLTEENLALQEQYKNAEVLYYSYNKNQTQWKKEKKRLETDLEMKETLIEQYKAGKTSEQTNEERCKILQALNMKLQDEKGKLENQLQKLTAELGTKTEEFRSAISVMREQNEASNLYIKTVGGKMKEKCKMCEAEEEKNMKLSKEINALRIELGKLKLEGADIKEREEKLRKEKEQLEKEIARFNEKQKAEISHNESPELKKLTTSCEMLKEENDILKNSVEELEKELEILKGKGGSKVELMQLRTAYNELEAKYKKVTEERSLSVFLRPAQTIKQRGSTVSFGQTNEGEKQKQVEESYNELKGKYETALAMSKDWKEKLQEVVLKQKEKAEKEMELKAENERLAAQYSQILKEVQDLSAKKQKAEKELSVFLYKLLLYRIQRGRQR
eukprot:TRINITY_DN106843_c0_g1_i1.p1 TRINITY_DN106843_c0_g1~~TRINITY_DN106843_c0_g1_i1.p1  ORF type:complete len:433 (-),score=107.91 TRINITY_DN106843_c0_g1_i1:330-1628(-)